MKIAKFLSIFLVFVVVFSLSGCNLFSKNYPVNINGVEITKKPDTICCLSNATASAISALGYGNLIVGAPSTYIDKENTTILDIGNINVLDEKAILNLRPSVVITPTALNETLNIELSKIGSTVIILPPPSNFGQVSTYYKSLATLILGNNKGVKLFDNFIKEFDLNLNNLKISNANLPKSALVFIEDDYVVIGDTLAGEVMTNVGINNLASSEPSALMSAEKIVTTNPDVIFCNKGLSQTILANPAYKDITAIKNGAVYEINAQELLFAGKDFIATLQDMSNYLKQ